MTTRKKPAASAATTAEPKGTAFVHIHPNLLSVKIEGRKDRDTALTDANAQDVEAETIAALKDEGFKVEVTRYGSRGNVLPPPKPQEV